MDRERPVGSADGAAVTPRPPEHDHDERRDGAPTVESVSLIRVQWARGTGCCSESTYRIVTAYYTPEGQLLWEDDPAPQMATP